ncbi:MAG: hypothetical protein ACJ76H_09630 [Bacteriovoracaceae bacterium]
MKTYFVLTLIAFQLDAFATEATVECHPENPHAAYSLSVFPDELVKVETHAFISGHVWSSIDHLEGVITEPAQIGGLNTVEFVIDTKEQNSKKKTYHFILKRPWESEIVSKCDITVIVK